MLDLRNICLDRIACSPDQFPSDGQPQVCFAGRSNVGKSSLLNTLVGRRNLARTSKTPGRTREIHFYRVADRCYLVDLPGYGYAHVSQRMRRRWGRLIEAYLSDNDSLCLMVVILDIRHDPGENDLDLIEWLESREVPHVLVLTRSDKVSRNVSACQCRRILEAIGARRPLGAQARSPDECRAICFSAKTGEGRPELIKRIWAALESSPQTGHPLPERLSR